MLTLFTIVLNGMPWIRRILPELQQLEIPWQWRICEGVASPANCTSWCRPVPERWHAGGRSIDGTSAYLDEISSVPGVSVYRQPLAYDGKIQMVLQALGEDPHQVVIQVDADEFWKADQLRKIHDLLLPCLPGTAAQFYCRYFVGPQKIVITRHGFGSQAYEWFRAWRWGEGIRFISHEPPRLEQPGPVISRQQTEKMGLIFDHMAYADRQSVKFKQDYYGYEGLLDSWEKLQETTGLVRLAEYFTFLHDATLVGDA